MKLESLPNLYRDGNASHKIVKALKERCYSRKLAIKSRRVVPLNVWPQSEAKKLAGSWKMVRSLKAVVSFIARAILRRI